MIKDPERHIQIRLSSAEIDENYNSHVCLTSGGNNNEASGGGGGRLILWLLVFREPHWGAAL